jgi:hypothetical protein
MIKPLNIRLIKSVGTYYKLEHLITPEDVQKMMNELKILKDYLQGAENWQKRTVNEEE